MKLSFKNYSEKIKMEQYIKMESNFIKSRTMIHNKMTYRKTN